MRNLIQILSLVFASSATAYLPSNPTQHAFEAGPSQEKYDGHQVWRLDVTGQSSLVKEDIREAINVSPACIEDDVRAMPNGDAGP